MLKNKANPFRMMIGWFKYLAATVDIRVISTIIHGCGLQNKTSHAISATATKDSFNSVATDVIGQEVLFSSAATQ